MNTNPLLKNALPSIPMVKVVDESGKTVAEGYYWAIPATSHCFCSDYERDGYRIVEGVVTYVPGDWGLPNTPRFIEVTPPHRIVPINDPAYEMLERIRQCRVRMIPHRHDREILDFIEKGEEREDA